MSEPPLRLTCFVLWIHCLECLTEGPICLALQKTWVTINLHICFLLLIQVFYAKLEVKNDKGKESNLSQKSYAIRFVYVLFSSKYVTCDQSFAVRCSS